MDDDEVRAKLRPLAARLDACIATMKTDGDAVELRAELEAILGELNAVIEERARADLSPRCA